MPDAAWKAWERFCASLLGGERRGADYGDRKGGKNDVVHDHYSVECKHGRKIGFQLMLDACKQAEAAAAEGQEPIAMIHRHRDDYGDGLVVMRVETFKKWRL